MPKKRLKLDRNALQEVSKRLRLKAREVEKVRRRLLRAGIEEPFVLRDHRKRGPLYHTLIFEPARRAPELFGLPPLKMINYRGAYLVDRAVYQDRIREVNELLRQTSVIKDFNRGKRAADKTMAAMTRDLRKMNLRKASNAQLAQAIQRFLQVRDRFSQYSFYLDTMVRSVTQMLAEYLGEAGIEPSKRAIAFASQTSPIEIQRANALHGLKLSFEMAQREGTMEARKEFEKKLARFMEKYADFGLVNFAQPLETRVRVMGQVRKGETAPIKTGKAGKELAEEKRKLAMQTFYGLKRREADRLENVFLLFEMAGNLSIWESTARQTWTRAHREAKKIMEELGRRAVVKGIYRKKEQVYNNSMKGLVELAKGLG